MSLNIGKKIDAYELFCYNGKVIYLISIFEYYLFAEFMEIDTKKTVKVKGTVVETLPGTKFRVAIDIKEKKHIIFAYISGRMRMNYIKLLVGDSVDVEISQYDLTKGRITYRY